MTLRQSLRKKRSVLCIIACVTTSKVNSLSVETLLNGEEDVPVTTPIQATDRNSDITVRFSTYDNIEVCIDAYSYIDNYIVS